MDAYLFIRIYYPYCIQKIYGDKFIVLNREYKPLGFFPDYHWDASTTEHSIKMNKKTIDRLKKISVNYDSKRGIYYLYKSAGKLLKETDKMDEYLNKLKSISAIHVRR